MKGFVSLGLLGSRLGREIYALAGLVAAVPIVVIAAIAFTEIESTFYRQAERTLLEDARNFSDIVSERLSQAARALSRPALANSPSAGEYLTRTALLNDSGAVVSGEFSPPQRIREASRRITETTLLAEHGDTGIELYMLQPTGSRIAVGVLSADLLWKRLPALETSTGLCVLADDVRQPLLCEESIPRETADRISAGIRTMNSVQWVAEGEPYVAATWPLETPAGFSNPRIRIVAAQPQRIALSDLAGFRDLYRPIVLGVILFTLLASGLYAKRILNPLAQMLAMSKRIASGDFSATARFKRRNELGDLADGLQSMAANLAQQFNAHQTLSGIDHVILSGADISLIVDLVLKHITDSLPCRRATVTILGSDSERHSISASMSHGHPVMRSHQQLVTEENREWLTQNRGGVMISNPLKGQDYDPFVALEAAHTYVLTVYANDKPAAAVSIAMQNEMALDEIQRSHAKDLAGRLAVALEAVSRSEALHRKAYFDDLTGLPNRQFCFNRLDQAIKQAKHLGSAVAVLFIDLDGFKGINDSLGHIAGDELIRQAAYRLAHCIGDSGTIGRLGGDEFAVILPFPVKQSDPDEVSERVLSEIRKPFKVGTSELHLSASIGVARFPEDGATRGELLRKADTAMYRAKETGRGCSVDYSHTMGIKVDKRMQLEADLRNALENGEIEVFYQPQIDMRTGRIFSAEALVRWFHPEKGLIPPDEFVPIAEDNGYISVLGAWIMSNACRQLARWQDDGLLIDRVAVNVSAGQFRRPNFVDEVESCLLNLHSAPDALEIELTERVFVDDLKQARQTLERLKCTGVSISIDDFGTGYSSLGYLKHLTFDVVKIDQSFVHELPGDKKSEAIVRAVLAMCHTLDKQVVAEGIENQQQLDYLRKAGVDIGQGYFIGRPMVAEQFAELARRLQDARVVRTKNAWSGTN